MPDIATFKCAPMYTCQTGSGHNNLFPGTALVGGDVLAGDWVCCRITWLSGTTAIGITPGYFLFHLVYTPFSDTGIRHEDQATTYGGTTANRRRNYHIDPEQWFQAPFNGQLSIQCGGDNPDLSIGVVILKSSQPRDPLLGRAIAEHKELERQKFEAIALNPYAFSEEARSVAMHELYKMSFEAPGPAPRIFPPPIIGTPQLVHASYTTIPANTPVALPDCALSIKTALPGMPSTTAIAISVNAYGTSWPLDIVNGLPFPLGALSSGYGGSDGQQPSFQCTAALNNVVIYSSLGG